MAQLEPLAQLARQENKETLDPQAALGQVVPQAPVAAWALLAAQEPQEA